MKRIVALMAGLFLYIVLLSGCGINIEESPKDYNVINPTINLESQILFDTTYVFRGVL